MLNSITFGTKTQIILYLFWFATVLCQANEGATFQKPSFCEAYDEIYMIKNNRYTGERFKINSIVDSACINGSSIDILRDDLLQSWSKVNDLHLEEKDKFYRKKMKQYALKNLSSNVQKYTGLADGVGVELNPKLKSCLDESKNGFGAESEAAIATAASENFKNKEKFIEDSFNKSILAATVMAKMQANEQLLEAQLNKVKMRRRYKNTKAHRRLRKETGEKRELIRDVFKKKNDALKDVIKGLSIANPLLFSTKNNWSLFDWNNKELNGSSLFDVLTEKISQDILSPLMNSMTSTSEIPTLENFKESLKGPEVAARIKTFKERVLRDNKNEIDSALANNLKKYLEGNIDAMEHNCKKNADNLHYNDGITYAVASDVFLDSKLSEEKKKEELIAFQAWQCKAWRDRPYKSAEGLNLFKVGGIVMVGAGAIASITGVGTLLGVGLIGSGTALLVSQEVRALSLNSKNNNELQTAYYLDWKTIEDIEKGKDITRDTRISLATEAVMIGGVTLGKQLLKLPLLLRHGRVGENIKTISSGATPAEDARNYSELIKSRHSGQPPTAPLKESLSQGMQGARGSTIPRDVQIKDANFNELLKEISQSGKKTDDANLTTALDDLDSLILKYAEYGNRIDDAVTRGINAREMRNYNQKYAKLIDKSHFENGGKNLPEFDPPLKVEWDDQHGALVFHYTHVTKNADTGEFVWDQSKSWTNSFISMKDFKRFMRETESNFQSALSHSPVDEIARKSGIFDELDEQAELYRELTLARQALIRAGTNVDEAGNFSNLTLRQNQTLKDLKIYLEDASLWPRQDGHNNLKRRELLRELTGLMKPDRLLRQAGGKYGDDAADIAKSAIPGAARQAATLGVVYGASGGAAGLVTVTSNRFGLRGVIEDFNELLRDGQRLYNKVGNPNAPFKFTSDEKKCAMETRGWTIENSCLLAIVHEQVIPIEILESQFNPEYDFRSDPELDRRVRKYIREFFKLRAYLKVGSATEMTQDLIKISSNEKIEQDMLIFAREVALVRGLGIIDMGIVQADVGDKLREQLQNYSKDPVKAIQAFEELGEIFKANVAGSVQNPELTPELKRQIELIIAEEYLDQSELSSP